MTEVVKKPRKPRAKKFKAPVYKTPGVSAEFRGVLLNNAAAIFQAPFSAAQMYSIGTTSGLALGAIIKKRDPATRTDRLFIVRP